MLTSRYYESEHDLRQMQDLLMAIRAATDDWRYPHIGVATFRFFMVASHLNAYEYVRLWHDRQGRLVAYALLGEDPSFDCEVAPDYEEAGLARSRHRFRHAGGDRRRRCGRLPPVEL